MFVDGFSTVSSKVTKSSYRILLDKQVLSTTVLDVFVSSMLFSEDKSDAARRERMTVDWLCGF